jgi:uncharacterized protein
LKQDKDLTQWAFEKYRQDYDKSNAMIKGIIEKKFAKLLQRPVFDKLVGECYLNGCCVPGQRKNLISHDGTIRICEKISTYAPAIGHVESGFDFEKLKKVFVDEYAKESIEDCSKCWGSRLCDLCYVASFNEKGAFDLKRKRRYCGSMLKSLERSIRDFVTLQEENPEGLDYLYQYELN